MQFGEKKLILGIPHVCVRCRECNELVFVRGETKTAVGICVDCDPMLVKGGGIPEWRPDPRGNRDPAQAGKLYHGTSNHRRFPHLLD